MGKLQKKGKKKSPPKKVNRKQDGMTVEADGMIVEADGMIVEADGMLVLRSNDGLELLVSKLEASQSITIQGMIEFDGESYLIPFDGDETNHTPIHLDVQGKILSKVVEYWKKHASGSQARGDDDPNWYAKFLDVDNNTLCDLILAASYLCDQGLIDLTCQTFAKMINGKSSEDIRRIFNITSDATRLKEKNDEKMVKQFNRMILELFPAATMEPHLTEEEQPSLISLPLKSDLDRNRKLKLEVDALRALHIVRCQEFTGYDPKLNAFICTRFCDYNIAFFDLDKLSMPSRGPPLQDLRKPKPRQIVQYSVNVISVTVAESDVGYPFSVFGTVLARDEFDYRCVYLFRRTMDDAQVITSPDDKLTLTDPCRGLDASDKIYFEIDLKIKTGGGGAKDFSKGLLVFNSVCFKEGTMTGCLYSLLSRVELTFVDVPCPLEATIAISVFKGACTISRVDAATTGNIEDHFICLYDTQAAGTGTVIGSGGSVVLTRRVVAVPLDQKLVLVLVSGDNAENLVLSIGQHGQKVRSTCKLGCAQLMVEVSWTVIPRRKRDKWEDIGGERLLQ
ncbi:uncharacterized protein LOC124698591 [Lolium rigidum]|uniref:uncharacterized protein LOC124698591 n=1 Tax=Lolium rigidum TaxID=89674 RepID=UPI001F5D43A6|nr:uncharacterized protein LOC124698591 [Lolium rigidum]